MPKLHPTLEPYQPTEADPFDSLKAAHLLSRATFGGTPDEIKKVVEEGPDKALDLIDDLAPRRVLAEEQPGN